MTSNVISREELLEEAYRIADTQGVSALSIRSLARASHVSVGTIYNHFSSKDELTTSTIELYFKRAVFDEFCTLDAGKGFVDYCEDLYASLTKLVERFRERWLRGVVVLPASEKAAAHLREREILDHALHGLAEVFAADHAIVPDLPEGLDAMAVSRFTLDNMFAALHADAEGCPVLFGLLRRALYDAAE